MSVKNQTGSKLHHFYDEGNFKEIFKKHFTTGKSDITGC